jgi:hypothetical protein
VVEQSRRQFIFVAVSREGLFRLLKKCLTTSLRPRNAGTAQCHRRLGNGGFFVSVPNIDFPAGSDSGYLW